MFWAYILRCGDGSFCTGHTDELEKRIAEHRSGVSGEYTATRLPVELAWSEEFPTRHEALEAERKIKGWSRVKKEALIAGDWSAIQRLARRKGSFETKAGPSASPSSQDDREDHGQIVPASVRSEEGSKPRAESSPRRTTPTPAIVLVNPQLGENIGKAARAMLNFGLTDLRLVAPRDGWPNPAAGPAAAGADIVLELAQTYATTAEAVADCAHVYATTVRKRGVVKPVLDPEQATREIAAQSGRSAILFGPERSGLETEDVDLARTIITVPINPEFSSLNLAQAVLVCAYEWSKAHLGTAEGAGDLVQPTAGDALPPAPQEDLEGLIAHLDRMLEAKGYFLPETRAHVTRRTMRSVLTSPGWNHLEVRTLRGILTTLERSRGPT